MHLNLGFLKAYTHPQPPVPLDFVAKHPPRLVIAESDTAGAIAAQHLLTKVERISKPTIGLATGGTMEPFYEKLVAVHKLSSDFMHEWITFNLDEYGTSPAFVDTLI